MAKDKNVEKKIVEKKEVLTNASVIEKLGVTEHKNREGLVEAAMKYLADKGVTKNIKGKLIDKQHLSQQLSAIVKCCEVGKHRWKNYTVVETETKFQLVAK